jgi:hypothetical protein
MANMLTIPPYVMAEFLPCVDYRALGRVSKETYKHFKMPLAIKNLKKLMFSVLCAEDQGMLTSGFLMWGDMLLCMMLGVDPYGATYYFSEVVLGEGRADVRNYLGLLHDGSYMLSDITNVVLPDEPFTEHEIITRRAMMSCQKISVQIVKGQFVLVVSDPKTWDRDFTVDGEIMPGQANRRLLLADIQVYERLGFALVI